MASATFTRSRPIVERIRVPTDRLQGPGQQAPQDQSVNDYIDQSLTTIGHNVLNQDEIIRSEFRHQFSYVQTAITEATISQTKRDIEWTEKLQDVDLKLSNALSEFGDTLKSFGNDLKKLQANYTHLSTIPARQSNATKIRPHHTIERVSHVKNGVLCWADDKIHPKTIRQFWRLGIDDLEQKTHLTQILEFYGTTRVTVPVTDSFASEDDEENEKELSVQRAVYYNQTACLEALAFHLGLNFDLIQREFERIAERRELPRGATPDPGHRRLEDCSDGALRRTKAKTNVQRAAADQLPGVQITATQISSSATSITSPRSHASGPRFGTRPLSSQSDASDSYATQPLDQDGDV